MTLLYRVGSGGNSIVVQKSEKPEATDNSLMLSNEEKRLLERVNKLRTDKQKPTLKPNPKLFAVARAHARAMAKKEKEEDEDNGKDTMARVKEAGYKWSKDLIAYNSAVGQNWNPDQCYQTWSQTLVPSENMKTETYLETGIGIAKSDSGNVFFYQIFAAPE